MAAPQTTSERAYRQLRQMVIQGELAPGDRLVQRQLAAKLGVSSIPIIEATRRLERDGLVVSHPNWGAQVQVWTDEDIEGAYLAREALEGIACRLFAQRAGEVEKLQLGQFAREFEAAVLRGDPDAWFEADLALHSHIVRATRASTLIHITESTCLITLTLRNAHRRRLSIEAITPEAKVHDALVTALLAGDPDGAERAGRAHVRGGFEWEQSVSEAGRRDSGGQSLELLDGNTLGVSE